MNLHLVRTYGADATTGTLEVAGRLFYTIELPWLNNEIGVSCIPEGVYELIPYHSPVHGPTWVMENRALNVTVYTPGTRTYCEIHAANWAEQLKGCIALGLDGQPMYDPLTGKVEPAVEESRDAVEQLIEILGVMTAGHMLTITRKPS